MYKKRIYKIKRNIFDIIDISIKLYENTANSDLSNCQRELVKVKWINIYPMNDSDE